MEKQQLVDIVLGSVKITQACVEARVYDRGMSRDYLEHVAGFYNAPQADARNAHLMGIQQYLVDTHSVEVQGVVSDPCIKFFKTAKYAFAVGSLCLLASPLLPVLAIVSAASAGASIGFSKLLQRREQRFTAIQAGLKEDVEGPVRAVGNELKAMEASELGALLTEYKPAISKCLLQQTR